MQETHKSYDNLEQQWKELEELMILGTERKNYALSDTKTNKEEEVLATLVKLNQLVKAKGKIGFAQNNAMVPPPPDEQAPLHPKSVHHLNLILDGSFANALEEFIDLVVRNKKSFPPESLPVLFDHCLIDPSLWPKIRPALTATGLWLQQIHPTWKTLEAAIDLTDWESGTVDARKKWLKKLRTKDPEKAIALLRQTWDQEPDWLKVSFIESLKINLSMNDEAFLEEGIKSESHDVQTAAASLLVQLKGTSFSKQLTAFAADHLNLTRDGEVKIKLPEKYPDRLSPLVGNHNNTLQLGARSSQFYGIIAVIPPQHWEKVFHLEPDRLLEHIFKSDWFNLLHFAMAEATYLHQDINWMEAFARLWLRAKENSYWNNKVCKRLISSWPPHLFNKIVLYYFNFHPNLPSDYQLIIHLLQTHTSNWEDKLAREVIRRIQNWLSEHHSLSWTGEHYQEILRHAAYQVNPDLFGVLQKGWPTHTRLWALWQKDVETFISTLLFRKEMRQSILEKTAR